MSVCDKSDALPVTRRLLRPIPFFSSSDLAGDNSCASAQSCALRPPRWHRDGSGCWSVAEPVRVREVEDAEGRRLLRIIRREPG